MRVGDTYIVILVLALVTSETHKSLTPTMQLAQLALSTASQDRVNAQLGELYREGLASLGLALQALGAQLSSLQAETAALARHLQQLQTLTRRRPPEPPSGLPARPRTL